MTITIGRFTHDEWKWLRKILLGLTNTNLKLLAEFEHDGKKYYREVELDDTNQSA